MQNIVMIGCGNMGGAMLAGWLAAGLAPERFTIVDPAKETAPEGVALLAQLPDGGAYDALILGIKPQMFASLAPDIARLVTPDTTLFSMLAGVELQTLVAALPGARGTVRLMPNLAAAIGQSPVALAGLGQLDRDAITAFFAPLGSPVWLEESLFDAVTALAGSGPAFVYRFIDALAAGAVALGLPADAAQQLALTTLAGAGALAAGADVPPAELAARVTSPGGTTAAGLQVLDTDASLNRLLAATLKAAADRSAELGKTKS